MKILIYTVPSCKFSAEEKTYLQGHNLPFEEKDVEKDHAALEEMLKVGNNFAGTPVTHITKDDGKELVLKGFTVEEFDEALGFAKKEEPKVAGADTAALAGTDAAAQTATPATQQPSAETGMPTPLTPESPQAGSLPDMSAQSPAPSAVPPSMPPAEVTTPTTTADAPIIPPMSQTPSAAPAPVMQTEAVQAPATPNPLDNILKDLQTQIGDAPAAPTQQAVPVAQSPMTGAPTMPTAAPAPIPPVAPAAQSPAAPAPAAPFVPDFPKTQ
jgi:glutaredoxin